MPRAQPTINQIPHQMSRTDRRPVRTHLQPEITAAPLKTKQATLSPVLKPANSKFSNNVAAEKQRMSRWGNATDVSRAMLYTRALLCCAVLYAHAPVLTGHLDLLASSASGHLPTNNTMSSQTDLSFVGVMECCITIAPHQAFAGILLLTNQAKVWWRCHRRRGAIS